MEFIMETSILMRITIMKIIPVLGDNLRKCKAYLPGFHGIEEVVDRFRCKEAEYAVERLQSCCLALWRHHANICQEHLLCGNLA